MECTSVNRYPGVIESFVPGVIEIIDMTRKCHNLHATPPTICILCHEVIDKGELVDLYDTLYDRADACGMESLTENEQALLLHGNICINCLT